MILKHTLLISFVFFTISCSTNNVQRTETNEKNNYIPNNDIHIVVGDPKKNIGQLFIEIKEDPKLTLEINVDKLPFEKTIDCCPKSGVYKKLNSFYKSFDSDKQQAIYETSKVDCNAVIFIQKRNNDEVMLDYYIRRLLGYYETKYLNQESKKPYTNFIRGRIKLNNGEEIFAHKLETEKVNKSVKMKFTYNHL